MASEYFTFHSILISISVSFHIATRQNDSCYAISCSFLPKRKETRLTSVRAITTANVKLVTASFEAHHERGPENTTAPVSMSKLHGINFYRVKNTSVYAADTCHMAR